ncbi:GtrA family protein [Ruegeria sp. HKCCC2117]|uniref:GtrA family protein n=1 Tax=Ruegeria sp. HKCCC2117 TaxID=2682992 RepID=UPI00148A08FC|nr:GtrA family protein [Ruegeria sp. HKCCC2117]
MPLFRSLLAFCTVGALASVTHAVLGIVFVKTSQFAPFTANALGYCAGFFVSYFGHYRFSFASSAAHGKTMPRFLVVSGAGLCLNQAIVFVAVDLGGLSYYVTLLIIFSVVPIATYILAKSWAFNDGDKAGALK